MSLNETIAKAEKEVLAFIPARGGSKGLPGKNLAKLAGVPLLAYSIMAARSCPLITRTIVSTDCEKIEGVAKEWGAEVPFLRPQSLAGDTALIGDAIRHTIKELNSRDLYYPSRVVVLMPTSPFRSKTLMQSLVGKLFEGYNKVVSVREVEVGAMTHFIPKQGSMVSLHGNRSSQHCYRRYGLFDGHWYGCRRASDNKTYVHKITTAAELVDIDTPHDLAIAHDILANGEFVPEGL